MVRPRWNELCVEAKNTMQLQYLLRVMLLYVTNNYLKFNGNGFINIFLN